MYTGPDIITRNLTPDKSGLPEGGHTLAEFKRIIRTGIDFDNLHPTCTTLTPAPAPANCIPSTPDNAVNGGLLQIMPWPTFANMTDHQLDAIYEYLSAIPCIQGPADPNDPLHNDCPAATPPPTSKTVTIVVNGSTSSAPIFQTVTNLIVLDASASTSPNAGATLKYLWTLAPGSPTATITDNDTKRATVQLASGHGTYAVVLKVTDSTGASSTVTITIQFI